LPRGDLDLFTMRLGGAKVEIVLPAGSTEEPSERMLPALGTLASISGRDVWSVAAEISMLDFDIIRVRLADNTVLRGSIPLRVAEKFLVNTRRFMASAAAAELKQAVIVEDSQKVGADYSGRCRFGHTFQGSFGFTIESPAGPSPMLPGEEQSPPPPERRIVERIATGLAVVESAVMTGDAEVLEARSGAGMNVNMLEDFTAILADSLADKITFDFILTPAWQAKSGVHLSSEISQAALPLIDRAVSTLRPRVLTARETVIGQVIMLTTRENPADLFHDEGAREVQIEGFSLQRGPVTVRVRLSPPDYLIAFNAHGSGRLVSITGLIKRSSRGNQLTEPSGLKEA